MTKYINADELVMQMTQNVAKASYTRKAAENPVYFAFIHATLDLMTQEVEDAPAADVAPLVYGHWIADDYGFNRLFGKNPDEDGKFHLEYFLCSECGECVLRPTNFCTECGAKMTGIR